METWTTFAPYLGLAGLLCALLIYLYIKKSPPGSDLMVEISDLIHEGAMTFLRREYTILFVFVVIVFALLFAGLDDARTSYSFLVGAACILLNSSIAPLRNRLEYIRRAGGPPFGF